jgi:hypothetical protein
MKPERWRRFTRGDRFEKAAASHDAIQGLFGQGTVSDRLSHAAGGVTLRNGVPSAGLETAGLGIAGHAEGAYAISKRLF